MPTLIYSDKLREWIELKIGKYAYRNGEWVEVDYEGIRLKEGAPDDVKEEFRWFKESLKVVEE